jgi:hypothetical protein
VNVCGCERQQVRPGTPLEQLIPPEKRENAWYRLEQHGFWLPPLGFLPGDRAANLRLLLAALLSFCVAGRSAFGSLWSTRRRAVLFPPWLRTCGDLTMFVTSVREHQHSGYRWTKNEIAFKVRQIIAESAGMSMDAVQPETTFWELEQG